MGCLDGCSNNSTILPIGPQGPQGPTGVASITGSGTINYIAKFTPTGSAVGDSRIKDDGTTFNFFYDASNRLDLLVASNGQSVFQAYGSGNDIVMASNFIIDQRTSFPVRSLGLIAGPGTEDDVVIGDYTYFRWGGNGFGVTGIADKYDGRLIIITNYSGTFTIYNENASSTAANRIITGTGADVTKAADTTFQLIYDSQTARWRLID